MGSVSAARWRHLGELLVQRRIELAPRYRERTVFAADVGLDWRLLHDIEAAKRTSFKPQTLTAIEVAYQWQPGSIQSILDGGEPVPVEGPSRRGADGELHYDDPRLQYVADTPGLPVTTRRALVELTRILLAEQDARQDRSA